LLQRRDARRAALHIYNKEIVVAEGGRRCREEQSRME
jgi:hypothetical protein